MRTLAFLLLAAVPLAAADYTVHEWGTFTSVSGSDGRLLSGLEVEEESLPPFVGSFAGFSPANKGLAQPVSGVTIKMETPVLYFYAAQPLAVRVDVAFHGGSISQWYPERSGGEQLGPVALADGMRLPPPIDFANGHEGSASWQVEVLPRGTAEAISARRDWETPQWPRARVGGANRLRGPKGEVEGFIFYRGIGRFDLPLNLKCEGGGLVLSNAETAEIPFAFVYEKRPAFSRGVVWWSGSLAADGRERVPLLASFGDIAAEPVMARTFPQALIAAGLNRDEAAAMLATWRESYFERDGLRVFWIVPRTFTDAVLPIKITPAPTKLERVLVGRGEVLTPQFEAELVRGFAADGGKHWENDRYFLAYRERVRQLGGVVGVAPATAKP